MPSTPNANSENPSQRVIDAVTALLVIGLLCAGLFMAYNPWARIFLILGSLGTGGIYVIYRRMMESGVYDASMMAPFKYVPLAGIFSLIVAATGGLYSPFIITLIYPVALVSLERGARSGIQLAGISTFVTLTLSLLSAGARTSLSTAWPLLAVSFTILFFVAYWVGILIDSILEARTEKKNILSLDHEKSEFIGLASHHLRTPLSGMKGYVDFLVRETMGPLNPQQRQIVERLDASVKKMEALVENLLMASSMEQGRIQIHPRLGDISRVIRSAIAQHNSAVTEKGLKLVAEIPDLAGDQISFDENRIYEAFNNLMANALKFTQEGYIKVQVMPEANVIRISVADSGIGIPRKELPHLFQKFARSTSIMGSFDQEGVGLGLYITRLIIEAHGGEIKVESDPSRGSVFSFTLPRG